MKICSTVARYFIVFLFAVACNSHNDNRVYKIEEGDILWKTESIGENLESAPAIDDYGNVYIIGGGSVDGSRIWATNVSAVEFNTPSVSPDNKTAYCGGSNGLYALLLHGRSIWGT